MPLLHVLTAGRKTSIRPRYARTEQRPVAMSLSNWIKAWRETRIPPRPHVSSCRPAQVVRASGAADGRNLRPRPQARSSRHSVTVDRSGLLTRLTGQTRKWLKWLSRLCDTGEMNLLGLPKVWSRGISASAATSTQKIAAAIFQLAELGQAPTAMVIACCDARVDVSAIFDAEPGSLFIMRNVANLVPPYEPEGKYHGTSAAVEYAATALKGAAHHRARPLALRRRRHLPPRRARQDSRARLHRPLAYAAR